MLQGAYHPVLVLEVAITPKTQHTCVMLRSAQVPEAASSAVQEFAPEPVPPPQLLARFRVNQLDTLAVFKAVSVEDFGDVASLLPPNTALPAADKMTYLLARLEVSVK